MWRNECVIMFTKHTDAFSFLITKSHLWSLVYTLSWPWISKTLVDKIILCFSDKRKFALFLNMDIKRIFWAFDDSKSCFLDNLRKMK